MTEEQSKQRQRTEIWSRVMGYHRPVSNYNKGKKSEFVSRKCFTETMVANHNFNEQYKLVK
jgi:hypothetical protein